jgi:hypothetical protein
MSRGNIAETGMLRKSNLGAKPARAIAMPAGGDLRSGLFDFFPVICQTADVIFLQIGFFLRNIHFSMNTRSLAQRFNNIGLFGMVLAGAIAADKVQAQISYDNTGSWNGSTYVSSWGLPNTQTFGETLAAPFLSRVSLDDFTFYLEQTSSLSPISFAAVIYAWSGDRATGSALFSQNLTVTGDGTFQAVTVTTGGVMLSPGASYVALFTTSDPTSIAENGSLSATFRWGQVGASVANDGGGTFVYDNHSTCSQLTDGSTWSGAVNSFGPLAWKADFSTSAVPEPSTIALVGFGVAGLFACRRKSNK